MRHPSFIIKNRILKSLSKHGISGCSSQNLAHELKVKHSTIYALCTEMALKGHVENGKTTTADSAFPTYLTTILQPGEYFKDKGGYTREWIVNSIIDFPKNFWWAIALFSYLFGAGYLTCERKKESTQQVQKSQQTLHK